LNLTEVQRIGAQVAAGLAAAHQRGLVHRDVKPGNILLEHGTGRVKLTDFGLARAVDDASLSREGLVAGTPEYMSPEQAKGLAIDHRTDLFSLGSVLYAMCTGRPPFSADGSLAVLARLANDTPPPIQTINPQIPSWLSDLVARLHAKHPDARFDSADGVAKLLTQGQNEPRRTGDSSAPHRTASGRQAVRPWHQALAATVLIAMVLAALIVPSAARWGRNKGQIERHPNEEAPTPAVLPSDSVTIPQHRSFQIDHQVVALAVSSDGRTMAAGTAAYLGNSGPVGAGNFPIVLWDLESNVEKRRLAGHHGAVRGLAFSADGTRLCSASNDRYLKAWNLESGEELSSVRLSPIDVYGLALSSDGRRLLAGCGNRLVRLLDVETGNELWQNGQNTENIGTVALSRDGRIGLTGGRQSWDIDQRQWIPGVDQSLHVWDLNNGQQRQRLSGHTAFVSCAAISADSRRILTGSHDKTIRVWSTETGDPIFSFTVPGIVTSVALSRDGRLALSAGGDTVVRLWDLENGRQLNAFHRHQVPACCVVFSPNGRTALSGSTDGMICVWQLSR
jgi:WD40 repeat protein